MKTKLFILLLFTGFHCAEAQTWTWSEDQLPYACDIISATVMDDSIFISQGRWDDNSFPNIAQIYDIGENQWETVQLQSTPRCFAEAVSANGMVFFAGGITLQNSSSKNDIDVYIKETDEWVILELSSARNYIGVTAYGNKVFFAGGINPSISTRYDVIDIYDTETDIWETIFLTEPKCMVGAVAAGGKVFFAGGHLGPNLVTDLVEIYDIETGYWTYKILSEARALTATVAYGNKIYFAGGALPDALSSVVVDVYNVETGQWEDPPLTLSSPRIVKALNVKDALIFAGECDYVNLFNGLKYFPNGIIDIYYPETGTWNSPIDPLNPARLWYGCAAYDDKAYFAGGGYPDDPTSIISILEHPNCFPDGIIFSTQEEIDNFPGNYPFCSEIEGPVEIKGDDITNLDSLIVLTSIGGELIIKNNPALNSLSGLDSINHGTISDLTIKNNPSLSTCDVTSVCGYLIELGGESEIHDNATGCDSQAEVESACLNSIDEIGFNGALNISPNPLESTAQIQYILHQSTPVTLTILDLSGRKMITPVNEVQQQGKQGVIFNTVRLKPGIYFCVLKTSEGLQTKKIIKL